MTSTLSQSALFDFMVWGLSSLCIAGMMRLCSKKPATLVLIVAFAYLAIGVGVLPTVVTLLFLLSSVVVGRSLYRLCEIHSETELDLATPLVLGIAAYFLIWSVLIEFPVNSRWLHVFLICGPLFASALMDCKYWVQAFRTRYTNLQTALLNVPYWSYVVSLVIIVGMLRYAFMPTVGHDDNVLHLRPWTELVSQGFFAYDLSNEIWGLAPNLVDVGHAVLSLVSGADARSAMSLVLGVILCWELHRLLGLSLAYTGGRLLILTLFVSTPLFAYQLTTLQTELALAVITVVGANISLRMRARTDIASFIALGAVSAMAIATKLPGVLIALSLVLVGLLRIDWNKSVPKAEIRLRPWGVSFVLFGLLVLASMAYIRAYVVTGNPVFPLMNGLFKSPYFDAINFIDLRYVHGFNLSTYWDMFINTAKYNETQDYTGGIQYLLIAPIAAVVVFLQGRKSPYLLLMIPIVLYGGIMFSQVQYLRYLFPMMPLLCVFCVSLLMFRVQWLNAAFALGIILCIGFNLVMVSNVSWYMDTPLNSVYTDHGKRVLEGRLIPEKIVNEFVNQYYPSSSVLYVSKPYSATLGGKPVTVNWHAPENHRAFKEIKTTADLISFLDRVSPDFVVMRSKGKPPEWQRLQHQLVREYLDRFGIPVFSEGDATLYRLMRN